MISDQEFLHGAAFLRLINLGQPITVTHAPTIHPSIYIVSSLTKVSGILFKISTKSRSAWSFTFSAQEDTAISTLKSKHLGIEFFAALVCHRDGICCLSEDQLFAVFDSDKSIFAGQRISVSRKSCGSYHINGAKKVRMGKTVPQNAWPKLVV
ncbi:MAG: hypothetical protein HC851_09755 [Acaryochloris sp. RU_4_1]|nr:hypothetical protein [Acaryochloris sp. SU_5_25]NJM65917.1 hypothetical protein [Acaryochloris sp. RU_4_1]NJR56560.1 hypothetical protein [Acaryochloris sp. CRU_2_0]